MKKYFNLKNLFLIGFVGGFIISLLKLSNLSTPYGVKMWLVIFAAVFSFILGYFLRFGKVNMGTGPAVTFFKDVTAGPVPMLTCLINRVIIIVVAASFVAFLVEAIVLGYVPIFMIGTPHAYSDFHIFGLHYITTSFILIPMLSVISFATIPKPTCVLGKMSKAHCRIVPIFGLIYSIVMPIILVSRFQLISGIIMGVFVFILLNKKNIDIKKVVGIIILFIILYILITLARSHSVSYLNEIFDMKDKNTPIFITQPYMYVAHNYENLNYLIENIPFYTYGRRVLQPIFALTLTKKFFPHVTNAPSLLIKEELSTGTFIYDFYFDFGILGVIIFMFIIGYFMRRLDDKVRIIGTYDKKIMKSGKKARKNDTLNFQIINVQDFQISDVLFLLLFGQNAFYMLFSFFQSYYSLTQTWVYFLFSILIAWFLGRRR